MARSSNSVPPYDRLGPNWVKQSLKGLNRTQFMIYRYPSPYIIRIALQNSCSPVRNDHPAWKLRNSADFGAAFIQPPNMFKSNSVFPNSSLPYRPRNDASFEHLRIHLSNSIHIAEIYWTTRHQCGYWIASISTNFLNSGNQRAVICISIDWLSVG